MVGRWTTVAVAVLLMFGMAGCEEDDKKTSSSLAILGISGDTVAIEGVFLKCYATGGGAPGYSSEIWSFDGTELSSENFSGHTMSDCSDDPPSTDQAFVVDLEVVGEKDATWDDTTPAGLDDTVTASTIDYTGDETGTVIGVVDDTGDVLVLYLGTEGALGADGYPDQLEVDGGVQQ